MTSGRPGPRLFRPAAAHFELLALVFDRPDGAENLGAEFAVRFADDFHRVFIVDDVTRRRIDAYVTARAVARIGLDLVDESVAVELAIEPLDGLEPVSYTH